MIYDDIIAYLSGEYRKGKTYQQIADERGLSFGYIHDLIHGRNKVERMSLVTFFKLFPSAQISLFGSAVASPACSSDELERVRINAERDRLAHERRELDLERQVFELEKRIAELEQRPARSPLTMDGGAAAPYRASSLSSQSTK